MYDSTTIGDCPPDGDLIGYYCDGQYATTEAAVRAQFPNAVPVPISAIGTNAGIVGDVERGDMTEAEGVDWVLIRRAAGVDPTIYCNELNGWAAARAAFAARGVPAPHWWVADYDGDPTIPAGAVAKQFRGSFRTPPAGTGAHYDQSSVADHWPGVDGVYGPGGGSLGGLDMATADQILAAVTIMPPKPPRIANTSDADLLAIVAQSTWADILRVYGQDAETYIYALAHPESRQTVAQAVGALAKVVSATVNLGTLQGDIAAIKAAEDAIKAQVANVEANLNAPRPPA